VEVVVGGLVRLAVAFGDGEEVVIIFANLVVVVAMRLIGSGRFGFTYFAQYLPFFAKNLIGEPRLKNEAGFRSSQNRRSIGQ